MVNAGRRSKCCFTCRERRVKCDLKKPGCQRCSKSGRQCPGYPEAWDTMLRLQNTYAENQVQTRVEKVRTKRSEQARRDAATIPRGVHLAAEVYSWNQFYNDYSINSGIPIFRVIPKFHTSNSSTCFQEALQSVTLASLARQLYRSEFMIRARWHYVKAIKILNNTLNDSTLAADDSVLLSLVLFSLFEMIVPDYFGTMLSDADLQCHIHFHGAFALLRWRAEQGRDTELDKRVFAFICYICLMSMFVNHESNDTKWLTLEKFMTPWMQSPLLESTLGRAVEFKRCVQAQFTTAGHRPSTMEVMRLINVGISISEDLEVAATNVKSSSDPDLPSHQQPTVFNNMFEVSTETTEAIARSLYRTVRYNVVESVLDLQTFVSEDGGTAIDGLDFGFFLSERPIVLEQICAEIETVLCQDSASHTKEDKTGMPYRTFGMFFPMVALLFSPLAGEDKRAWLQEKLRFVSEKTGFGLAAWSAGKINILNAT